MNALAPLLLFDLDPDPDCLQAPPKAGSAVERLARLLVQDGHDQPVRALEAMAVVVVASGRDLPLGCALHDPPDRLYRACVRIARRALAGILADPTQGARRYHRADDWPDWAAKVEPLARIGSLLFYP